MSLIRHLGRALRLRCPACGRGPMFRGWFAMNRRCGHCGLWFEPEPGYYLGSIFVNYSATAALASVSYLVPMILLGRPPDWLLIPVVLFCLVFPLAFFRYARSLWLAVNYYFSPTDPSERPHHESSS